MATAKRPVIVVGGGAISADATDEVRALAEGLDIPVVTTWNGKSAFPEDHDLFVGSVGQTGTIHGNYLAANADVVVSIGCRFTDWSSSSYAGASRFSFPPAKLIHIDIDPHEIGKIYPAEVGILADAKPAVAAIVDSLSAKPDRTEYLAEVAERKADWENELSARRDTDRFPFTLQRPLAALRRVMDRSGIVAGRLGQHPGHGQADLPGLRTSHPPDHRWFLVDGLAGTRRPRRQTGRARSSGRHHHR